MVIPDAVVVVTSGVAVPDSGDSEVLECDEAVLEGDGTGFSVVVSDGMVL